MEKRERFTAYITKYALTEGIKTRLVEDCFANSPAMVRDIQETRYGSFYHGHDWHRTKADAIRRAKEMQAAKLKSIDKQRGRIAALKFD